MRVAIVSDIHGNLTAFDAVLEDLKRNSPDLILHGGDLAQGGARPAEVVDKIRALGWPGVCGNTDEVLWAPEALTAYAAKAPKLQALFNTIAEMIPPAVAALGPERIAWLKSLPKVERRGSMALVHASPNDLWRSPLVESSDAELAAAYGSLNASLVVYGHIHRPFIRQLPGMTVANSGSVSMPYDGDIRASYLLVDDGQPSIRRVEYELEREVEALQNSGLPHADWAIRILRAGQYVPIA
ncbi:MAG TPA: metallophosphoesterase family protein [Candidatus Binatia bacterium]|nr:metallophosphoesterase family protein [Candidatus Binatia bacterium]